jgi:hypothetical protein
VGVCPCEGGGECGRARPVPNTSALTKRRGKLVKSTARMHVHVVSIILALQLLTHPGRSALAAAAAAASLRRRRRLSPAHHCVQDAADVLSGRKRLCYVALGLS